jgi:uncharacterized surface protein with fasciclin (FAS1) repeats
LLRCINKLLTVYFCLKATSLPVSAPVISPTEPFEPTAAPDIAVAPADTPVVVPVVSPAVAPVDTPSIAPISICDMYDFGGKTEGAGCSPNILDSAREMSDLSLSVILFERAGLTGIFDCAGPFTVQLPTNEAVENVDAALLDFLLQPANQDELRNLMLYHVLPGSFPTSALVPGPASTLAGGAEVEISLNPTMFNNATVVMADIPACNGLINIIDSILTFLPTSKHSKSCMYFHTFALSLNNIIPHFVPSTAPTIAPTSVPKETSRPSPAKGSPTISPTIESIQPESGPSILPATTPTIAPIPGETTAPGAVSDPPSASPGSVPVAPPVDGGTTAPTVAPVPGETTAPGTVSDPPSASPGSVPVAPPVDGGTTAPTVAPVPGGTTAPGTVSDPPSGSPNTALPPGTTLSPSTLVETDAPGGSPTEEPVQRIRVENFFLAYVVPGATTEPTPDQITQLAQVTNDFFTDTFTTMFAGNNNVTFLRSESTLGFTLFGAGIPAARFNVYTDYNYTDLIYTANSTPPDAAASFVIMRESINQPYIVDYVRSLTGTPFETTNEVIFRASTMDAPTNRTEPLQRSDNSQEDTSALTVATVTATSVAALLILAAGIIVYRKKRSTRRRDEALYDGVYAVDGKATLEGYFSETSVTDASETAGKFSKLPVVKEEREPLQVRV